MDRVMRHPEVMIPYAIVRYVIGFRISGELNLAKNSYRPRSRE